MAADQADIRADVLTLLQNFRGTDPLKELFWSRLNYDRENKPIGRRNWPESAAEILVDDLTLLASGGKDNDFKVLYARLAQGSALPVRRAHRHVQAAEGSSIRPLRLLRPDTNELALSRENRRAPDLAALAYKKVPTSDSRGFDLAGRRPHCREIVEPYTFPLHVLRLYRRVP
jgi:hypothetical protein